MSDLRFESVEKTHRGQTFRRVPRVFRLSGTDLAPETLYTAWIFEDHDALRRMVGEDHRLAYRPAAVGLLLRVAAEAPWLRDPQVGRVGGIITIDGDSYRILDDDDETRGPYLVPVPHFVEDFMRPHWAVRVPSIWDGNSPAVWSDPNGLISLGNIPPRLERHQVEDLRTAITMALDRVQAEGLGAIGEPS